ncbi:uncharacterized protein LOC135537770 [Oncorhynchus masou masou]|uniref:uncharacterized protein LOC135537770 n=1 Tax=Oncorhynchus masou masou TaxID=90313 RepID=UPI003183EEAA
MPSLSSVVQFSLLLVLLLAVMGQDCATSQVQSEARSRVCVKDKVSDCVDLTKMQELIQEVQKDFTNTSHDGRILLKTVIFDKIKKHKKYHGCVLLKIMDFYREVLQRQDRNYLDLRGLLDELKECVQTGKICEKLYQEAAGEPVNESKIEEDLELLSKDAAILQLQRLEGARKKVVELSERATLDKAMAELQRLEDYIQGRGLRRTSGSHRTARNNTHTHTHTQTHALP